LGPGVKGKRGGGGEKGGGKFGLEESESRRIRVHFLQNQRGGWFLFRKTEKKKATCKGKKENEAAYSTRGRKGGGKKKGGKTWQAPQRWKGEGGVITIFSRGESIPTI